MFIIVLVILLVSLLVPKSATNLNDGLKNVAGALLTFGDSIATIRGDTVYEEKAAKVIGYIYADEVHKARQEANLYPIIGSINAYKTSSRIRIPLKDDDDKPIIVYYLLEVLEDEEKKQYIGELGNFELHTYTYIDKDPKKIKRSRWHNIGDWVMIRDKASVFNLGVSGRKEIQLRKGLETWQLIFPSVNTSFRTKKKVVEEYDKYKRQIKKSNKDAFDEAFDEGFKLIEKNLEKKAKDPSCQCVDYGPYKLGAYDNTNRTFTKFGHCKSWKIPKIPGDVANDKNTMMPPNYYNQAKTPWCLTKKKNNGKCKNIHSPLGTEDEKIYNWKECVYRDKDINYTESKDGPSDADIIRSHDVKLST